MSKPSKEAIEAARYYLASPKKAFEDAPYLAVRDRFMPVEYESDMVPELATLLDSYAQARVDAERAKFVEPLITLKEMGRDYKQGWVCEFINNNQVLGWLLDEHRQKRSRSTK